MKNRFAILLTLCTVLLLLGAIAVAQVPAQFSADMMMTPGKSGVPPTNGKFFFSGTKTRMEMSAGGQQMIMITDLDRKVVDQLMPQQQMYMEHAIGQTMGGRGPAMPEIKAYDPNNPCSNDPNVTCKKVGTEMMNGRMCDKWEFTGKPGTHGVARTLWIDRSNHIPIKTVMPDGMTIEFKNLKEGHQAASLFQVPSGYQKMDLGNMMRGMKMPTGDD